MNRLRQSIGFTIVELTVVIAVIGILAAVSAIGWNSWRNSLSEKTVTSDFNQLLTGMNNYKNFNEGYPILSPNCVFKKSDPSACGVNFFESSDGVTLTYISGDGASFCVNGVNASNSSVTFYMTEQGKVKKGTCAGGSSSPDPYSVVASSLGEYTTCVLASNNKVYCWGYNGYGQLGNGSTTNSSVPVAVVASGALLGKTIESIQLGASSTSCVTTSNNRSYCWGLITDGASESSSNLAPVAVTTNGALSGKTIKSIYPRGSSTCVVASDDHGYCWGYNGNGQLGNNSTVNSSTPVAVTPGSPGALAGKTIKAVSGSAAHSCVIASDDLPYCWGYNGYGQLGNGSTTNSNVPVAVSTGALAGKKVKAISVGGYTSCAIASDDNVYCWGTGGNGTLGNNSSANSSVPVAVTTGSPGALAGKTVKSIAVGSNGACVIASDNLPYCWGLNSRKQLGNGTSVTNSLVPVAVTTSGVLSGKTVTSIAAGSSHFCVIGSDKLLYCWGRGDFGQIGDGSTSDAANPVRSNSPY